MWFANLKIRTKLLVGFGAVLVLTILLSGISLFSLKSVDNEYNDLLAGAVERRALILEYNYRFTEVRRIANYSISLNGGNAADIDTQKKAAEALTPQLNDLIAQMEASLAASSNMDETERAARMADYESLSAMYNNTYLPTAEKFFASLTDPSSDSAAILAENAKNAEAMSALADTILQNSVDRAQSRSDDTTALANTMIATLVGICVIAIIVSIVIALIIAGVITKTVVAVANAAHEISKGNFDVKVGSNARDELGGLSNNLRELRDVVMNMIDSIAAMTGAQTAGDIDARISEKDFKGEYNRLAKSVNSAMQGAIDDTLYLISAVESIGNGHFDMTVKAMPGKKIVMTDSLNAVLGHIRDFDKGMKTIISAGAEGQLDERINAAELPGDWGAIGESVNDLMATIVVPIRESIAVLEELAKGNLSVSVKGDYKGEFAVMKNSINTSLRSIASYIQDIGNTLDRMAKQDLTAAITRDFLGDFNQIKQDINTTVGVFNKLLTEINGATEQVASGARQISEASMNLAEGTTEQAGSIQNLNNIIGDILEQTNANSENAEHANKLAIGAKSNAETGNSEMKNMLSAMEEINTASENISKIIKVIDDIAFQTNILALNAAVEAARAGQYGKGFAVVAEEVRSLAARSQNAAKDTSQLIEGTVQRVNEGSITANKTAESLGRIVSEINEISTIISSLAESSEAQADAINNISTGISQISIVTQANSATSEQQASSSEELSSQAELFRSMVSRFKLS